MLRNASEFGKLEESQIGALKSPMFSVNERKWVQMKAFALQTVRESELVTELVGRCALVPATGLLPFGHTPAVSPQFSSQFSLLISSQSLLTVPSSIQNLKWFTSISFQIIEHPSSLKTTEEVKVRTGGYLEKCKFRIEIVLKSQRLLQSKWEKVREELLHSLASA